MNIPVFCGDFITECHNKMPSGPVSIVLIISTELMYFVITKQVFYKMKIIKSMSHKQSKL